MYSVHFRQKKFYMKGVFQENSTFAVSTKSWLWKIVPILPYMLQWASYLSSYVIIND